MFYSVLRAIMNLVLKAINTEQSRWMPWIIKDWRAEWNNQKQQIGSFGDHKTSGDVRNACMFFLYELLMSFWSSWKRPPSLVLACGSLRELILVSDHLSKKDHLSNFQGGHSHEVQMYSIQTVVTHMADREIQSVSWRLLDNLGELVFVSEQVPNERKNIRHAKWA